VQVVLGEGEWRSEAVVIAPGVRREASHGISHDEATLVGACAPWLSTGSVRITTVVRDRSRP
jgi:hypothetical protein